MFRFVTFIVLIVSVYIGFTLYGHTKHLPPPTLDETWWGPGKPSKDDTTIKPFKINVSEKVLNDLKHRLENTRDLIPSLEGTEHQYGINHKLLTDIVTFWKNKYDWRAREKLLNKFPQFKTQIQGLDIHFIHIKPEVKNNLKVLPMILLHGWPGSVKEFYEVIPVLTMPQKGRDFVFEVIVPSLPGYGFSQGASKSGMGAAQLAVVFNNLMKRLGYTRYLVEGGDWGALIVASMAALFPENVIGLHSNACWIDFNLYSHLKLLLGSLYPSIFENSHLLYPLNNMFYKMALESGYAHIQATKPDTVGVALNNSPVGLAAYIIEKFITWTNESWKNKLDGGLTTKFTYDDLLDNVMIYWISNSITTSARLYSETLNSAQIALNLGRVPITVPSACARFHNELLYFPKSFLEDRYTNLVYVSDYEDGGHFAAFELPQVFSQDIYDGVDKILKSVSN